MKIIDKLGKPQPIKKIKEQFIRAIEKDLNIYVKKRYEEVVAPFRTDFTFEITSEERGDYFQFNVRPILQDIPRSANNPERGDVSSWILFNTLDLGSDGAARIYLPDEFGNESAPNSLATHTENYDRDKIFVDASQKDQGMEPRNWSQLIREEYENKRLVKTRAVAKDLFSRVFGK